MGYADEEQRHKVEAELARVWGARAARTIMHILFNEHGGTFGREQRLETVTDADRIHLQSVLSPALEPSTAQIFMEMLGLGWDPEVGEQPDAEQPGTDAS